MSYLLVPSILLILTGTGMENDNNYNQLVNANPGKAKILREMGVESGRTFERERVELTKNNVSVRRRFI